MVAKEVKSNERKARAEGLPETVDITRRSGIRIMCNVRAKGEIR